MAGNKKKKVDNSPGGSSPGRPSIEATERLKPHTVYATDEMWERIEHEAAIRNLDAAKLSRQIFDWFLSALDKNRDTTEVNKSFDDK